MRACLPAPAALVALLALWPGVAAAGRATTAAQTPAAHTAAAHTTTGSAHTVATRTLAGPALARTAAARTTLAGRALAHPAAAHTAAARAAAPGITPAEAQGLELMLSVVPARYASADPTHTFAPAAVSRTLAADVRERVLASQAFLRERDRRRTAQLLGALGTLTSELRATTEQFQPWPLTLEVKAWSARAERVLDGLLDPPKAPVRPYRAIEGALSAVQRDAAAGQTQDARFQALRAFALYAAGPGARLELQDPSLDDKVVHGLLLGSAGAPALVELLSAGAPPAAIERQSAAALAATNLAAQALAEVRISHATIVADAAIIVFREGLEAVLILAAITASFVGAKRHLRRPVLLGALAGLLATALTWVVAQMLLHLLGEGGLELQAITGLIAIGVLLLVTNWFFHRMYWSEWISRFNRRRKALERLDRFGFVSGQVLGFVLLGLSSVYREGLETVLFLQALQTSAGTSTTLLGAGIGLGGTLIVGTATFNLQRKLPFKRMLVVTGVLIALVLAVMVGTTVHNLQAIGWVANTPTSFHVPLSWNIWLGVYATWQGIVAQVGALVFVVGSYFAAREFQVRRPQRRARRAVVPAALPEIWGARAP
jgi:high-affinity iron transporter